MQSQSLSSQGYSIKRYLPLAILLALMGLFYASGLQRHFSLAALADNEALLHGYVNAHLWLGLAIFIAIYFVMVAISFPGAGLLSIVGGFVFGWALSAPAAILAATMGSIVVFKIVQTSIGGALASKAGPFVQKLASGFEKDAFTYLLFARLVPAFPFWAVNAVAGLTRMSLGTFSLGTLLGIIPGGYAFAFLGGGLGSVIESARGAHATCLAQNAAGPCPLELSTKALVTPQLLFGLAALGLVSLVPLAIKKLKRA